jgi:hypothetical protein
MLDDFEPLVLVDCLTWSSIIVLGVFFYWLFGKESVMVKVYLTPQERDWLVGHLEDFAYRIAKDDETKTLASDLAQKFRLAPNLDDGCAPPSPRQPGAGYTRRDEHGNPVSIPHPNDGMAGELGPPAVPRDFEDTSSKTAGMQGIPYPDTTIDPKNKR